MADVLSRLSSVRPIPFDELEELLIKEIVSTSANVVAIKWKEILQATLEDAEIQQVLSSIRQCQMQNLPVDYRVFANELCEVDNILLRVDRIVIPEKLRMHVLKIGHEGHLGMHMMKSLLRSVVWWPKIDRDVENFVRKCRGCTLVAAPEVPEPMKRKRLPMGPWEDIAIDFMGPLPEGQWLLVVVDYYSRFIEVVEMSRITVKDTVEELATIFGRFGIPTTMRADNGPQLSSECKDFLDFCTEWGIELVNTTPYWPQANGEVERQNRSILKRLRIAQELGQDWRLELRKFLLAYHATNHSVTGRSPSELLYGRRIKSKLPEVPRFVSSNEEVEDRDRLNKEKGKQYADKTRRAHMNQISIGDYVYVKRMKKENKLCADYSPELYKVIDRVASRVTIRSTISNKVLKRNVAHLKIAILENQERETVSSDKEQHEMQYNSNEFNESTVVNDLEPEADHTLEPVKRQRQEPKKFSDYVSY